MLCESGAQREGISASVKGRQIYDKTWLRDRGGKAEGVEQRVCEGAQRDIDSEQGTGVRTS